MLRMFVLFASVIILSGIADAVGATRMSGAVTRPSRTATISGRISNKVVSKRMNVSRVSNIGQKSVISRSVVKTNIFDNEKIKMTDYCKAQYTQCMDNFCNVLDDNQGRCSCSANLKNYSKTEEALKQATENLQDVAQQIQYIGLSKDEVETLFAQTEAELSMSKSSDTSQLKNDLEKIKNMIVDVKSGTATTTDTGMNFDLSGLLDFSISSTGFDLASLFGTGNNTSSISNQRGEQLYKTATARCKAAVLNTCANQGVDVSVITNAYDLEIDKQCIAYERSLSDANDQMSSTVRNAKSVLQKARLMVAQQKNAYDLRGCVNALDTCMQDEFVCGSDYENCLDPTGKYIVNGEIVIGSEPDKNAPLDADIATMLRNKIGIIDSNGRTRGLCASVMKKCQNYTMDKGKYNADNLLIKEYVARTGIKIKARRAELLNEYARECLADVSTCLTRNNYGNTKNSDTAIKSCLPTIRTCKSVVSNTVGDMEEIKKWLADYMNITVVDGVGDIPSDTEKPYIPTPSVLPPETVPGSEYYAGLKNIDEQRCLSITGGRISASGTMCVIWGKTDAEFDLATSYGWAQLKNWGPNETSALCGKTTSDYDTGQEYAATLYIMKWAYEEAQAECNKVGGTLDFAPGIHRSNAFAFCRVEFDAGKMSESECASYKMVWPTAVGDQDMGGKLHNTVTENGKPVKQSCDFIYSGLWYVGKDLPGACLPGMEEMSSLGSCTCKEGLFYDGMYRCTEDGQMFMH